MSAVGATEVLKPILLRSSTPGPNEKVLLYLEGMRDSQMSQIGSPLSSGFPNLQQPSPKRSTLSAARLEETSRSQVSYRNGDDGDRDEIDSNVQEGRKSEITIGIHSTGMPEPGPQDPPGPRYESFDSGPSFGNLGPLPDNGHNSGPLWTTWEPNWPSSTPHTGVNVPLPMSMASPTSASLQINIEPPSSASGSKTRQSRSRSHSQSQVSVQTKSRKSASIVESEDRATVTGRSKAPSKAPTRSAAPGDEHVISSRSHVSAVQSQSQIHSVRSRSTTKVQSRTGTDYPPLPPSTLLSPSGRTTQLLSSPRSHRREPSVSPSDSPSQAYLKKAPQSPGKEKVRSMVSGGGMSDGEGAGSKSRAMSGGPMSPSHHNRPFSPYRHAATHEDLLFAASSATQTQVQQRQQSVLSRSEAGNKVRSSKLSDIHSHQSRSHRSQSHVEADGGKTPTPSRPESPSFSLNQAEEELVAAALASRGPRTRTSYAPSALETEIVNSHFHDMDLCILLHQMDDNTTHEVVKKALRKAVRQRVKKLGMNYDQESIKQYQKSFHNHDPSVHLDAEYEPNTREPPEWAKELMNGMIKMHERLDVLSPQSLPAQMPPRSQASYVSSTATREQYRHTEYTDGGDQYEEQTPRTQTVNINTQPTGTMAESMYQPGETEIDDGAYGDEVDNGDDDDVGVHMHGFGAATITETRGISEFMTGDRDDSPGQQFLEEELYKLRVKPGGSQSAITHKTWEVARDDQDEYEEGHGAFTESGLPEIPDSGNYTDRRPSSPPLPALPNGQDGSSRRDVALSQNSQVWNQAGGEYGETLPPPWQRIHQRLLSWAIIWPMSEIDGALNSTTRGQQVDEVALSIWSTQTYKRYVRSRMTDSPGGRVDRLFVPPNMADAISTAVFNGRHGDACGMLRDLWAPFGLEGSPRLIVVLAKHRSDENHWVVHRFSLPDGALTTYDSYPERTLPDGRPLGWWFAIRVAWPGAIYANPDHLMQKMVRLHRPMQLNIDNSVAAAGIWRNVLMGSRAERSLDLERLRDLINTEVKNLRQRKLQGKLSLGSPKPNWEDR